MAGHKGFGLSFMIDVLAGCLTGAGVSPGISGNPLDPSPQDVGHLFLALHVQKFRPQPAFDEAVASLVETVHSAHNAIPADPFLVPGEPEATAREARTPGIPLDAQTVALLSQLGDEYGLSFRAVDMSEALNRDGA